LHNKTTWTDYLSGQVKDYGQGIEGGYRLLAELKKQERKKSTIPSKSWLTLNPSLCHTREGEGSTRLLGCGGLRERREWWMIGFRFTIDGYEVG
jgi:hypothetical protein